MMTPDDVTINTLISCNELLDSIFNMQYITEQDASDLHMAMATLELVIKRMASRNLEINTEELSKTHV